MKGSRTQKAVRQTSTSAPNTSSRLDCDFERNLCQWRNLPTKSSSNPRGNDLNWYRRREQNKGKQRYSAKTIQNRELSNSHKIHILTGYYLRIRQTGQSQNRLFIGSVVSPEVSINQACLRFSYRQSLRGAYARMRVKALERYGNQEVSRTKRYLTATESWKEEKIDLTISRPYKVKIYL